MSAVLGRHADPAPGIAYLHCDVRDAPDEDLAAHFLRASDFIARALGSGAGGSLSRVLVHCFQGETAGRRVRPPDARRGRRVPRGARGGPRAPARGAAEPRIRRAAPAMGEGAAPRRDRQGRRRGGRRRSTDRATTAYAPALARPTPRSSPAALHRVRLAGERVPVRARRVVLAVEAGRGAVLHDADVLRGGRVDRRRLGAIGVPALPRREVEQARDRRGNRGPSSRRRPRPCRPSRRRSASYPGVPSTGGSAPAALGAPQRRARPSPAPRAP